MHSRISGSVLFPPLDNKSQCTQTDYNGAVKRRAMSMLQVSWPVAAADGFAPAILMSMLKVGVALDLL